nr:hypothetical protein BaRGS_025544 [Batillaria attramentaria]
MLMSDTWQPAVLHLLPFSTNDASNPRPPSSACLRALPTPDHSRGFPVLAVTRRGKDSGEGGGGGGLSGGFPPGNRLTPQRRSSPVRASSERLPRSQSQADLPLSTSRAKSDYNDRRGNRSVNSTSRQGNALTRDNATCSITDLNERIMSRMMMRADSSSPDSAVGSHGNSPFSSATPEAFGTSGPQGLPKPAFLSNGPSPNGVSSSVNSEGRYLVSGKNGLWRSVTMTPGELELKKHREHLDRAQTMRNGAGEPKAGKRYKLNVKDLPRSSTPVNDHDPDKLNMKQVIAFLQSKGKSQADAVELPKDLSTKVNKSGFRRAAKSGVMRSRVHRILTSSSTAEIAARVMTGKNGVEPGAVESSPKTSPTTVRVRDVSDNARSSTSLPPARACPATQMTFKIQVKIKVKVKTKVKIKVKVKATDIKPSQRHLSVSPCPCAKNATAPVKRRTCRK